ncbi:H-type lectin domain-containing protein [Roseovarius azorensis]|uniref:H-type lectin domain-containing protein n=1 Tax=Roseovarius azorensis TaxID=1287727 RepID=A0A1H7UJ98_9RHOB|nr:H-type lectin domain-containing protein [Roseovarius azorensis]SEL97112.1 H-type lectin domain-containing protein [Roseovarius azorensis]
MQVFIQQAIGIDQGDDVLFTDYADGGDMWTGKGDRERRKKIAFSKPFKSAPVIHIALSLWDIDSARNTRADVTAEKITSQGFEAVFCTWGDTRVARVRVRWMAIGAAFHEDDWRDLC